MLETLALIIAFVSASITMLDFSIKQGWVKANVLPFTMPTPSQLLTINIITAVSVLVLVLL